MFYAPDMNARASESLRLENRLRRAIDAGELVLHYQPKVSVRGRRLTGAEALMRWQDPERGLVPPAEFIPVMEQTGLIFDASRWALTQAIADARRLESAGHDVPRIAVNVSALDLRDKDFVRQVIAAVGANGSFLELEITESIIMDNIDASVQALSALRDVGITVAIDDFGTGYSSLAYIAKLPINALKIDRSFITGMMEGSDNLAIVRSIISLAHSLNLKVVAEGVETNEQVARLWQLGCNEMQGYVYSPPLPFLDFSKLILK
jgi:EAL domain-containing protein (putative c-di-GMP-specific phosphodiesterase class I)